MKSVPGHLKVTGPTGDSARVSVKFTVLDQQQLIDSLESMAKVLIERMETMSTSCYPLEIELSLTMVKRSDSTIS